MADLYIIENTRSAKKPFSLCVRSSNGEEVEWSTICDMTGYSANILIKQKANWYGDEPDWEKHYKRVALLEAAISLQRA